ncbi:hypothetical protein Btru_005587 [Bulinus truncatus]|nr:hypothetical protein Btru_005587 [Bulinus truncatus]
MDNEVNERSNFELSEKLHKTELKLTELDEEAQNTYTYLERERQKCAELEESVSSSALARQLDLRDIWRLVQKDVESECQEQQEDAFNLIDSEQIKEKIKRDIEALRSKLHNRETALGVLKDTYIGSGLSSNSNDVLHSFDWYTASYRHSPGSSLVDALTIDVLNGNLPMYPIKYPYSSSLVSCEDVDCYECSAARLLTQTRYTSSCPSISPLDCQPVHNFSFNNNNFDYDHKCNGNKGAGSDNTHINSPKTAAQSSGTPKRQRSLYGNNRRQNFIKRSGKCAVINTTQSVSSDQLLDTARHSNKTHIPSNDFLSLSSESHYIQPLPIAKTINDVSCLVRRSSFKRAVEGEDHPGYSVPSGPNMGGTDCDDLRRPSFCAAIDKGKEECGAPCTKRKVVQINPPDTLKVRTKNMKENAVHCEQSKTVTFQLNEEEVDGTNSYCCRLPSTFQTLPSSLMSTPYICISSEPDNGLVRSDSTHSYKLQMFLEDVQSYTVPKSMEDWDMVPQNVGYDQDPENIENLSDPEQVQEALELWENHSFRTCSNIVGEDSIDVRDASFEGRNSRLLISLSTSFIKLCVFILGQFLQIKLVDMFVSLVHLNVVYII